MNKERKSIYCYIIIVFLITYSWELGIRFWWKSDSLRYQIGMPAIMWIPAVAVLLSKLLCREKVWLGLRSDILIWNPSGNGRGLLYGIAAPLVCSFMGNLLLAVCYRDYYDYAGVEWEVMISGLLLQISIGIVYAFLESLWAEIGWRGFLMPRMLRFVPMPVMLILSGILWGLWQAPLIYEGYRFGSDYWGAPWSGIVFLCLFGVLNGAWLYLLYERSKSILCCALSHGLLNSLSTLAYIGMKGEAATVLAGNVGIVFLPYVPTMVLGIWSFVYLSRTASSASSECFS